jgi:membrane protease YdiL (CAAX protease family)
MANGPPTPEIPEAHQVWPPPGPIDSYLRRVLRRLRPFIRPIAKVTVDQWRAIDEDIRQEMIADRRAPMNSGRYDWRLIVVLVVACLSLTLQEYFGERSTFEIFYPREPGDQYWTLKTFGWWSGWRVFGYLVIPMIAIALMPGERIREYHLSTAGFVKKLWIYVTLFALVFPAVILASYTDAFQHTYPFYKLANRSPADFWIWEGLYWVQFLSLEFFFRGFLLRGLRYTMGSKAIFVMIVPYCMIHYGKPLPETMGAIGAGLILGTLAMRTKSIWGGVLIHVCVAFTMDYLALGYCPEAGMGPCGGQ